MTQETLNFIHASYNKAVQDSKNILEIVETLYLTLSKAEVPKNDSKEFYIFVDGLRNCLRIRRMTSDITDVTTCITISIMHIIRFLNDTQDLDIDISLHGRRKALESDLTKLLRKATETYSAKIRDRFGLRGILLNENEESAIENIYILYDAIIGILAAKNDIIRNDFMVWVKNNPGINSFSKNIIFNILDIPFDVDGFKDYIKDVKSNGYQSLHFTLVIQPYSLVIPGAQLEVQLRTKQMDFTAKQGSAAHEEYKKYEQFDPNILKVFVVDDFQKINIPGFTSYTSKDDDEDGIHFSKQFADRRISKTLVFTK